MPRPPFDRRSFLLAAGTAPAAAALGRINASRSSAAPGDPDDMAALGRLAGLTFSDKELEQAGPRLDRLRGDYATLRAKDLSFELSPCTHFDPYPLRLKKRPGTARTQVAIPTDVAMPANEKDIAFLSVLELASLIRQKKITAVRLTELFLQRLEQFGDELKCVVNTLRKSALRHASDMDRELGAGIDRGPLHGIPYGAKDLFAWPGAPTTFGATPFKDHEWQLRATALSKLERAGAVLVAKLSLGSLAMGDLWHGGRTRNPYNPEQGSSGSSAGPASAVAAGLVPFAIGTETLGSIVSPCRRCGIAGLRPTFGAVSRFGAMPLSWTMDKVGPIARTALCAGIVFDTMRGEDRRDPSSRDTNFRWQPGSGTKGLYVGVLKQKGWPRTDDDKAFIAWLEANNIKTKDITLPDAPYRSMLLMLHAEAAAAFDDFTRKGLDDQLRGQDPGDWPNQFRTARTIPAVEYLQASRLRKQLVEDMHTALGGINVLVAPTHGGPTLTATNLTGHPTYVLPIGKSKREQDGGRPNMISLVGHLDGEGPLLQLAEAWQNHSDHHLARPALTDR